MTSKPTRQDIQDRISADIKHFHGQLPERTALVWYGYIGALLEWDLISVADHDYLRHLLPSIEDNPMTAIFLGRNID